MLRISRFPKTPAYMSMFVESEDETCNALLPFLRKSRPCYMTRMPQVSGSAQTGQITGLCRGRKHLTWYIIACGRSEASLHYNAQISSFKSTDGSMNVLLPLPQNASDVSACVWKHCDSHARILKSDFGRSFEKRPDVCLFSCAVEDFMRTTLLSEYDKLLLSVYGRSMCCPCCVVLSGSIDRFLSHCANSLLSET